MKYVILFLLVTYTFVLNGKSQIDTSKNHVSLGLNLLRGIATFSGDNVINYSYNSKKSVDLSTVIRINKKFGFGIEYSFQDFKVKDTKYVGAINNASIRNIGLLLSYSKKVNENFIIESIISVGRGAYRAQGKIHNPYYSIGVRPKFRIWNELYIIGGYNLQYHKFSVNAPSDLKSFYSKGIIHNFNIGISIY